MGSRSLPLPLSSLSIFHYRRGGRVGGPPFSPPSLLSRTTQIVCIKLGPKERNLPACLLARAQSLISTQAKFSHSFCGFPHRASVTWTESTSSSTCIHTAFTRTYYCSLCNVMRPSSLLSRPGQLNSWHSFRAVIAAGLIHFATCAHEREWEPQLNSEYTYTQYVL